MRGQHHGVIWCHHDLTSTGASWSQCSPGPVPGRSLPGLPGRPALAPAVCSGRNPDQLWDTGTGENRGYNNTGHRVITSWASYIHTNVMSALIRIMSFLPFFNFNYRGKRFSRTKSAQSASQILIFSVNTSPHWCYQNNEMKNRILTKQYLHS